MKSRVETRKNIGRNTLTFKFSFCLNDIEQLPVEEAREIDGLLEHLNEGSKPNAEKISLVSHAIVKVLCRHKARPLTKKEITESETYLEYLKYRSCSGREPHLPLDNR